MLWARVVPRHQFDGERGHAGGGDFLNCLQRSQRPQEANQNLVGAQQAEGRRAGTVVGAVAQNLDNNVGGGEHGRRSGAIFAPFST